MKRRISGALFGVLFCTWVVSAVAGLAIVTVSSLSLIDPEAARVADGHNVTRPPAKRSTSAAALALGVLMVVWPLPFCRRSPPSDEFHGFGRDW